MESHPRPRLTPALLTVSSLTAALGLTRVFAGNVILAIFFAAVLPHLLGAFLRRFTPPIVLEALLPIVILMFFLTWVTPHNGSILGFPTVRSLHRVADTFANGAQQLRHDTVPLSRTGGAFLLALVVVWLIAQIADALAFRARAPFGAVIPSLALFVVTAVIGDNDHQLILTAAYALVIAVYLLASHAESIDQRNLWFGNSGRARRRLLAGGSAIALAAVVFATAIAPHFPDANAAPLVNYKGLGSAKGPNDVALYSPVTSIIGQLRNQSDNPVFTVQSTAATSHYWRIASLRKVSEGNWVPDGNSVAASGALEPQDITRFEQQTIENAATEPITQHIVFAGLTTKYLPAAYRPVSFKATSANLQDARVIVETSTLITPNDAVPGDSYTVVSDVPRPYTAAEVNAIAARPAQAMPKDFVSEYTQLPGDFDPRITLLARSAIGSATTPYAEALALQSYFAPARGFVYTLTPKLQDADGLKAISAFLLSSDPSVRGHGYCVQFASAFVEMARALGIPSRLAVGFTSGEKTATGWLVRGKNAHAWPEVWLPGEGWVPFEPTPGPDGNPLVQNETPTTTRHGTSTTAGTTVTTGGVTTTVPSTTHGLVVTPSSTGGGGGGWKPWQIAIVAAPVGAAALGGAYAFLIVGAKRRRRARRHAGEPREVVLGAWAELLDRLAEFGIAPRLAATPVEFAHTIVAAGHHGLAAPLEDLARLTTVAQWSRADVGVDAASTAWHHVATIVAGMNEGASRAARWRRHLSVLPWRPRPLVDDAAESAPIQVGPLAVPRN